MGFKGVVGSLLLCASIVSPTAAWDKNGHEAIGMTAMSALNAQATTEVKRLMGGRDVVDISDWGLKVMKKFPWTESLQTEAQADDVCGYVPATDETCSGNLCLVQGLKHFWGRLTDDSSDKYVELAYPRGVKLTDADQVKFLVSLIGALHNPIALGRRGDDNGKQRTVTFNGQQTTLFDVWNTRLVEKMMADRPNYWYSGWTHVNAVKGQYEADKRDFHALGAYASFEKWAQESAAMACNTIYNKLGDNDNIDAALAQSWQQTIHNQLLIGGARTAIVLNALLEHQAAKLSAGTYLAQVEDEEQGQQRARKVRGVFGWDTALKNLGINAALFSGVLALFVLVERKTIFGAQNHHRPVQMTADVVGHSRND